MYRQNLQQNWTLVREADGSEIPATVPGDVTVDLFNAGKIKNPYFGLNHLEIGWIARENFTYKVKFTPDAALLNEKEVYLTFNGVDTFAEVYLNGEFVGKMEDMFLSYRFEVKARLNETENLLEVRMLSTLNEMDKIDCTGYFGVFNVPRLFVRKAQCHFGWDWAPDLPGYGIWDSVSLQGVNDSRIEDVTYVAGCDGKATFLVELNYNIRATVDNFGVAIEGTAKEKRGDKLVFRLEKAPNSGEFYEIEYAVTGKKNFVNFSVENPQLWWPTGYGKQPLYAYEVALYLNGEKVSEKNGRMAFREVELVEEVKNTTTLGYALKINGTEVFVRGSNWVPIECFTGTVTDDKYEKLVRLAKDGNMNMLRVWGGGIYEKDIFYDLCDELGLMVWQDFMFACSDLPEDNSAWVDLAVRECEYQIRRLRNHPSLVYWCGGNEKTGSYGLQISKGDYFIDCTLQGLVASLDKTRPYARQSPCSWTDVGNDLTSGESHYNSFERSLVDGVTNYRELVAEKRVPFASECAVLGPNSMETNRKIYPEDKLFPLNEYWEDRLMDNPYSSILMNFTKRQLYYIKAMYGEAKSFEDFTAKGMAVQAEMLRAEAEFSRSGKGLSAGFINWMYSDIWPSGSWAVVDYFLEPKQAYYELKRAFAPLLLTFTQNEKGQTELIVVNDRLKAYTAYIRYGEKKLSGEKVWEEVKAVSVPAGGMQKFVVADEKCPFDSYLFVAYAEDGVCKSRLYSPLFWRGIVFDKDYSVKAYRISATEAKIVVKANAFTKGVFLYFKDNYKYIWSDNYIDLEAGETKVITVKSEEPIDINALAWTDFATLTE